MAQVRIPSQGASAKIIRAGSAFVVACMLALLGLLANGSDRNRALIPVAHVVIWAACGLSVLALAVGGLIALRDRRRDR